MKNLDDVMLSHIQHIIFVEMRPFSYLDFRNFKVQGEEYNMKHVTFRNKISKFARDGIAEVDYKSNIAFYSLKGVNFRKKKSIMTSSMTPNHMGINSVIEPNSVITDNHYSSPAICDIIQDIPPHSNALHDIHYRFKVPGHLEYPLLIKEVQTKRRE
jgi:hypothetical protein